MLAMYAYFSVSVYIHKINFVHCSFFFAKSGLFNYKNMVYKV